MSEKREKISGLREIIANRMKLSLQSTAQYTLETKANVTSLLRQRREMDKEKRVSVTDILLKVVAETLLEFPYMNGTSTETEIALESEVNIGLAVATDNGLMVPVIHNVESMTLAEISVAAKEAAARAKIGRLKRQEFSGGTFTISNLGMFGIEHFTPVINLPEIAILGVGAAVETPHPCDDGADGVEWVNMLPLSLTIDHRVVDGADAARFLAGLVERLSTVDLKNYQ